MTGDPLSTLRGLRFTVAGVPAPQDERTLARFFAKVDKHPDGCWQWMGARSAKGYGSFGYGPTRTRGGIPAHRAAYEMFVGPIPPGLVIDHLCRNRSCVNPAHLEPVTNRENILRGNGRAGLASRRTHCDQGHEFTPANTSIRTDRENAARRCKTCKNAVSRERYWANKAAS